MGKNLIQQARGKGSPRYKSPGFKFVGAAKLPRPSENLQGTVKDIVNCPGHDAPLMQVEYLDGQNCLMQAPVGIRVGDTVGKDLNHGTVAALQEIPEGTPIFNIEKAPGDGGKFVRASGTFARVVGKTDQGVVVLLPSKKEQTFHKSCRACIGVVAGSGRKEKPLLKAGKMHFRAKARNKLYPRTHAHAMNAVDHPFGNKRSSRKAKNKAANKHAPPGAKVGSLWPKRTGRRN